jgi:protein-tyrosine kinase
VSIIEQAAKRLEQLRRGGVDVPWEAAGLTEARFKEVLSKAGATPDPTRDEPVRPAGPASMVASAVAAMEAAAEHKLPASPPASRSAERAPPARQSASVTLDLAGLERRGYLVPSMVRSNLALQFRHIKRPLLRNAREETGASDRSPLIMITSALPGEGKTFCSVNLAMSIAMEVDTSVLLVDADVVRPAVLDRLGLPPSPGLMDVLVNDKLDLSDVILRTNVPKLSVLPAGSPNVLATELLASAAMDRLLTDMAARYADRVIILDAPPLLVTTEARVLASRVGQVVIVVDSTRTTTARVAEAFAAVEGCQVVTSILNKTPESASGGAYDYGYGYGYR